MIVNQAQIRHHLQNSPINLNFTPLAGQNAASRLEFSPIKLTEVFCIKFSMKKSIKSSKEIWLFIRLSRAILFQKQHLPAARREWA